MCHDVCVKVSQQYSLVDECWAVVPEVLGSNPSAAGLNFDGLFCTNCSFVLYGLKEVNPELIPMWEECVTWQESEQISQSMVLRRGGRLGVGARKWMDRVKWIQVRSSWGGPLPVGGWITGKEKVKRYVGQDLAAPVGVAIWELK
jgi:hypothetical protein